MGVLHLLQMVELSRTEGSAVPHSIQYMVPVLFRGGVCGRGVVGVQYLQVQFVSDGSCEFGPKMIGSH